MIVPEIHRVGINHSNSAGHQHDLLPYWTCQGHVFHNKIHALIHASQINSDIEFRFNDHVLDNLDWSIEPPHPIDYYYDQRAKSIRDSYDYVVVMYSGGADSSTVLKSFLRQNLAVDEIAVYGLYPENSQPNRFLWNQEIIHAATDLLNRCSANNIKISNLNLWEGINRLDTVDWIWQSDPLLMATQAIRYPVVFQRADLRNRVERGQKVCLVFGHDKSKILVKDSAFYHVLLDVGGAGTGIFPELFASDYVGPTMELFHINTVVPEIMIKQAHMMATWYWQKFGSDCTSLLNMCRMDPKYSSRFNSVCYPTTWREGTTYSLGKGTSQSNIGYTINTQATIKKSWEWKCEWLQSDLAGTLWHHNWKTGLRQLFTLLDPKFVNQQNDSLVGHYTTARRIADLPR